MGPRLQVPPPPPNVPAIMAQDVDQDAELIAAELLGEQVSENPEQDAVAEQIADELLGIQQAPPPPPIPKEQSAAAPAGMQIGFAPDKAPQEAIPQLVNRPTAAPEQQAPVSPQLTPLQSFGAGLSQVGQQAGDVYNHLAQQAMAEGQERRNKPLESAGAALVGVPRGIVGFAEDIGNTQARLAQPFINEVVSGATGFPLDLLNQQQIPAPLQLRQAFDQIPGVQQIQQQFPASVAGGEAAGVSMIPAHVPGLDKVIGNPVLRGTAQGAVGGEVLGAVGSAGQQAQKGPVDLGKAAKEGVPTAVIGAGLGAAAGSIAKAAKGAPKTEAKAPEVKPETAKTGETVKMKDGSEFTRKEAVEAIQDKSTPEEVKSELQELLAASDQDIVNLGKEGIAKKEVKAEVVKPEESKTKIREIADRMREKKETPNLKAENERLAEEAKAVEKTPEELHVERETKLYPNSDKLYGSISEGGVYKPRDFTDSQIQEHIEFLQARVKTAEEYGLKKPKGVQGEIDAFVGEKLRREQRKVKGIEPDHPLDSAEIKSENSSSPPASTKPETPILAASEKQSVETLPKSESRVPQNAPGEVTPPAESPKFNTTRRFGQGNTGEAVKVTFPDEISAKLNDLGSQRTRHRSGDPTSFDKQRTKQLAEEVAQELGVSLEEVGLIAEKFNNKTKQQARDSFKAGQDEINADNARDFIAEAERPELPPREELEAMTFDELNKLDDPNVQYTREQQELLADVQNRKLQDELKAAEEADIAKISEEAPQGDRYTVEKTKTGSRIIDSTTGEVVFDNKQGLSQNTKRADTLNEIARSGDNAALEKELRKGSKNVLTIKKGEPGIRKPIVESGQPVPEGHRLEGNLRKVAEAKQVFDEARANFFARVDAFDALTGRKPEFKSKRLPVFDERVEKMVADALKSGSDEIALEVQNAVKLEPGKNVKFKRGTTTEEALAQVEEAWKAHQEANKALRAAKKEINKDFIDEVRAGNLNQSVNVETGNGKVNIRLTAKQGTALNEAAEQLKGPVPEEFEVDRKITSVRNFAKDEAALDASYEDAVASIEKKPKRRTKRNQKGSIGIKLRPRRNQKGQLDTTGGKDKVEDPTAVAIAKGAKESKEISDLANNAEKVKSLLTAKNSLDIINEVDTKLHNDTWLAIGKEATLARRAKFNPADDFLLIEDSLRFTPEEIRQGGPGGELSKFTPEQLDFLATRKTLRTDAAKQLRAQADKILEEYGTITNMPNSIRNRFDVMRQVAESFAPRGKTETTNEAALAQAFRTGLYDYIFRWNPAYHGLNLLDPLVIGSSRVGISNVFRAKAALQDQVVKDFVRGTPGKDTIRQLREQAAIANQPPKGVKETGIGKTFRKVREFNDAIPDIPSERWNLDDSLAAAFILRGQRLGKNGTQYLKDLASGKLGLQEEIEATVEAMQVADELTGSSSLGINKNIFQRNVGMNSFAQFVSQPIRVTRLLRKYASEGNVKGLLTFAAMNIAFGGRSVLPLETDVLKSVPQLKPLIESLEDALDAGNVVKNIPVIGRDLTEKLRFSIIAPFSGGISTPLATDFVNKFMQNWEGEKWDKVKKASFLLALSSFLGGGGVEANRLITNYQGLMSGDKKYYAVTPTGKFKGSTTFQKQTGQKFGVEDAIKDSLLPGVNPKVGEFQKLKLRK